MEYTIREATLDDYEEMCEVYMEVDTLHIEALPQVFREPDGPARSKAYVADLIAESTSASGSTS